MIEDEMLTIEDLAAYLKLKPQTIYKWAQTGKIPGAKFGKEWRFRRSTIEQWIDDNFPPRSKTPPPKVEDGPEASKEARSTASAEVGNSTTTVSSKSLSSKDGKALSGSASRVLSPPSAEEGPATTRKKGALKGPSARKKAHGPSAN